MTVSGALRICWRNKTIKCPECENTITVSDIKTNIDADGDRRSFIEVEVFCLKCEKTFFDRVYSKDLISTE